MNKIRLAFFAALVFLLTGDRVFGEDSRIAARGVFALLPTSVFESEPTGMSEIEKQEILSSGKSEYWEILRETPDELLLVALPFRDRIMGLRLFRGEKDAVAAIGSLREPDCALELWRIDGNGGITLEETPEEPDIREFFAPGRKPPKRVRHDSRICLDGDGLRASPLFWNNAGVTPVRLDYEIIYRWTGKEFVRQSRPRRYSSALAE